MQTKTTMRYHLMPVRISSIQFSRSVMSDSLWPHGQQHTSFAVHHQLTEPAQIHVHQVGDAIQPLHSPSSPSPSAFNLSSITDPFRVFSNKSVLPIRWPKYWSFSLSISPSNEHPVLISFRMDCYISLQSKGLSRVFSNTTIQKHQFFCAQLSWESNSHIHTWPQEKP